LLKLPFQITDFIYVKLRLFFILSALSLFGCSTAVVVVKSDPSDAEVSTREPRSGARKTLGKTPLRLDSETLFNLPSSLSCSDGTFAEFIINKDGYEPAHYFIPTEALARKEVDLDVKLFPGSQEDGVARNLLEALFSAQRFAELGEFEHAHAEVDKALALSPGFPRAFTMRGSIFYLQKKYNESLKAYEQALVLDPKMEEAMRMIAQIRNINRQQGGQPAPVAAPAPSEATPAPKQP
jgi:tetratricopeptide (TPR) repeat protein